MPQYVLVNRRSGRFTSEEKSASRSALAETLTTLNAKAEILSDDDPSDELARRVVVLEMDASTFSSLKQTISADVIAEPLIRRHLHFVAPIELGSARPLRAIMSAGIPQTAYEVTVVGGGKPLSDIEVLFYLRDPTGSISTTQAIADAQGSVSIQVPAGYHVAFVEPIPTSGYWITLAEAPSKGSTIDCPAIAPASASGGGWWHDVLGIDLTNRTRGEGIKVGVIDTGCGPHQNLAHVTLAGVFVDNQKLPGTGATDVAQHGTHTSGIIGARPQTVGDYAGLAPGCDLFHARVFKSEDQGPSQADLIRAIDALSKEFACDLVNMSLGGGPPSEAEEDAIRDAEQRGTLCICSAGNDAGPINYPAAYQECAAVSAIGKLGEAPAGTFSAGNRPKDATKMGTDNLFLASFSSFGPTLACAAPGVGIVSTVPSKIAEDDRYMEMDGTSMASPAACGVLAVILSASAHYRSLPRDGTRTDAARALLNQHCRHIGLSVKLEGRGVVSAKPI